MTIFKNRSPTAVNKTNSLKFQLKTGEIEPRLDDSYFIEWTDMAFERPILLVGSTLLGGLTSVVAPGATQLWGVGAGIALGVLAGAANQAGLQYLAFGKIINSSYVGAAGAGALVGSLVGLGTASGLYSFGFSLSVAGASEKAVGIGLGIIGGPVSVQTPTKDQIFRYYQNLDNSGAHYEFNY